MVRLRFKLSHDQVHSFKVEYTYNVIQLNKQEAHGCPQKLTCMLSTGSAFIKHSFTRNKEYRRFDQTITFLCIII